MLALTECVERHARHEQAQLFPRLRESLPRHARRSDSSSNERLAPHDDDVFTVEERRRQAATAH